jgi:putative phosphoribosyl transferase
MNKTYPFQNLSFAPEVKPEGSLHTPVTITSDGLHLTGDLVVPPEATGLVLFAQGGGSGRFSPRSLMIAEKLQMAGFGTLLFDTLTREEEAADAIHLHLRGNIPLLARRLAGVTRWARSQPETYKLVIGYAGSATGSAAALVAAAELGSIIRAIVSRSGQPELAPVSLARVRAATLFIVGEHEKVVLHHNTVALEQLFCEKQLAVVPHATHAFAEQGAMEEVSRLTLDWFQRYLHP